MYDWYVVIEEEQQGPYPKEKILQWIKEDQIKPEALVWREGMAEWIPVSQVPELQAEPVSLAAAQSPTSTRLSSKDEKPSEQAIKTIRHSSPSRKWMPMAAAILILLGGSLWGYFHFSKSAPIKSITKLPSKIIPTAVTGLLQRAPDNTFFWFSIKNIASLRGQIENTQRWKRFHLSSLYKKISSEIQKRIQSDKSLTTLQEALGRKLDLSLLEDLGGKEIAIAMTESQTHPFSIFVMSSLSPKTPIKKIKEQIEKEASFQKIEFDAGDIWKSKPPHLSSSLSSLSPQRGAITSFFALNNKLMVWGDDLEGIKNILKAKSSPQKILSLIRPLFPQVNPNQDLYFAMDIEYIKNLFNSSNPFRVSGNNSSPKLPFPQAEITVGGMNWKAPWESRVIAKYPKGELKNFYKKIEMPKNPSLSFYQHAPANSFIVSNFALPNISKTASLLFEQVKQNSPMIAAILEPKWNALKQNDGAWMEKLPKVLGKEFGAILSLPPGGQPLPIPSLLLYSSVLKDAEYQEIKDQAVQWFQQKYSLVAQHEKQGDLKVTVFAIPGMPFVIPRIAYRKGDFFLSSQASNLVPFQEKGKPGPNLFSSGVFQGMSVPKNAQGVFAINFTGLFRFLRTQIFAYGPLLEAKSPRLNTKDLLSLLDLLSGFQGSLGYSTRKNDEVYSVSKFKFKDLEAIK